MKIKDLIAAVRTTRSAAGVGGINTELDLSRMECAQLQSKINELEPLVDEYYQESCGKEYAANQERQKVETLKKALASFARPWTARSSSGGSMTPSPRILMMVVSASTTPPWRSPAIPISPASSPMRTTAVSLMRRTVINC